MNTHETTMIYSTEYQEIVYYHGAGVVRKYKRYGGVMRPVGSVDRMTYEEAVAMWSEGMA